MASVVGAGMDAWSLRAALCSRGLVETAGGGGPRSEETVGVPLDLWTVLRGPPAAQPLPWAEVVGAPDLEPVDELVLPELLRTRVDELSARLADGPPRVVVVRGPPATDAGACSAASRGRPAVARCSPTPSGWTTAAGAGWDRSAPPSA